MASSSFCYRGLCPRPAGASPERGPTPAGPSGPGGFADSPERVRLADSPERVRLADSRAASQTRRGASTHVGIAGGDDPRGCVADSVAADEVDQGSEDLIELAFRCGFDFG